MRTVTIKIYTENAAFDGAPGMELAFILRELANSVESAPTKAELELGFNAYDSNGNHVGQLEVR
jgi:hypothetical protein